MTQGLPPFRVLSLDGGGMRGTYTATYLDKIADTFAKRRNVGALDIGAGFDLIVGTSTGGIIAPALATGVPLSDIVALYVDLRGTHPTSGRAPSSPISRFETIPSPGDPIAQAEG